MMITKKVRLKVPKEMYEKFNQFAGSNRFAYNWALKYSSDYYDIFNKTISVQDLCKEFTKLRNNKEYSWLKDIPSNLTAQSIRDFGEARKRFFNKLANKPKIKKKKISYKSFYQDCDKIKIKNNSVQLTGLGIFKFCQKDYIPDGYFVSHKKEGREQIGVKPLNPRITFDGIYWYLSVAYEIKTEPIKLNENLKIGIDLGLKTFATVCYNDETKDDYQIEKIKTLKPKFKRLLKRKKRLDRKISKQNKNKRKVGEKASKNYIKLLQKRIKFNKKMTNIQLNLIYNLISQMVKSKPSKIVIENLNIKGMMKNYKLAKWIQFNQFYTFRKILDYKCKIYGIELIIADRFFPSSKICSCCGNKKDKLSLSERTYYCIECKYKIDRDDNASINLSNYID